MGVTLFSSSTLGAEMAVLSNFDVNYSPVAGELVGCVFIVLGQLYAGLLCK